MNGAEIPKEQWVEFLEQYAREHDGWIVELELAGNDAESSQEADRETEHTLEAIETYLEDDEPRIVVFLADRDSIVIEDPERITATENDDWEHEVIEFETPTTYLSLHLRVPQAEVQLGMTDEISSDTDSTDLLERNQAPVKEEIWIEDELGPNS